MALTQSQIGRLNRMTRAAAEVRLGDILNSLLLQLPEEKHFCSACFTISEKTDSRGNCVACGSPFDKETAGV